MNEFEVGTLANDLNTGYMSYQSLTTLSRTPHFSRNLPNGSRANIEGPRPWPHKLIPRKDGTVHIATQIGYAKMAVAPVPTRKSMTGFGSPARCRPLEMCSMLRTISTVGPTLSFCVT